MIRSSPTTIWLAAALPALLACGGPGGPGTPDAGSADGGGPPPDFGVIAHASVTHGNAPLEIAFWAELTGDASAEHVEFAWGLGDDLPTWEVAAFTHSFEAAGGFTAVVQATWTPPGGAAASASDFIHVELDPCADLALGPVTLAPPLEVAPGAEVALAVGTLVNHAAAVATPFAVDVVLSDDDLLGPEDPTIGTRDFPDGIASGALLDVEIDLAEVVFTIPADTPPDTYFVYLVADRLGLVGECREDNNLQRATNSLTVDAAAALLPDLEVSEVSVSAGVVVGAGDNVDYAFDVANLGAGASGPFALAAWLSADLLPSADDLPIATVDELGATVAGLAPGQSQGFLRSWKVPQAAPEGLWYVVVAADPADAVVELDESNNASASPWPLTVAHEAPICFDLSLASVDVVPAKTYWNGTVAVRATVDNPGTLPTPHGWQLTLALTTQPTPSPGSASYIGSWTFPSIPAGGSVEVDEVASIPATLPLVPHHAVVLLDAAGDLGECRETNNTLLFDHALTVSPTTSVELAVAAPPGFHPGTVVAGHDVKVTYELANNGSTAATAFEVVVVLSPDPLVTQDGLALGQDVVIHQRVVAGLEPEVAAVFVDKVTPPLALEHSVGAWYVGVALDPQGALGTDVDKADNVAVSAAPLQVLGAQGGCFEDAWEPNDTPGSATPLGDALALSDLGSCGNEDWWQVTVPAGHSLFVSTVAAPILSTTPGISSDLELELYVQGQLVDGSYHAGSTEHVAALIVPEDTAVALRVFGVTPAARASYDLSAETVPPVTGVDLLPTSVEALPPKLYPGGLLAVTWADVNLGSLASPSYGARLWLSGDDALQPGADVLVDEVAFADGVPAQSSTPRAAELLLPQTLLGGAWRVLVELDPGPATGDLEPGNDVAASDVIWLDPQLTCADDDLEPNDAAAIASPLAPVGGSLALSSLVVCPQLDDWYAVSLAEGQALTATVAYGYADDKGLVALELWEPGGTGPLLGHTGKNQSKVTLPWAWAAGAYLLRVRNQAEGQLTAPYAYALTLGVGAGDPASACEADAFEPNDSFALAADIGCGDQPATLCKGDVDVYRMELGAGQVVTITLAHPEDELEAALWAGTPPQLVASQPGSGELVWGADAAQVVWLTVAALADPLSLSSLDYSLHLDGVPGSDLLVGHLGFAPSTVVQGEDTLVDVTITNACIDTAPATSTALWLSLDAELDDADVDLGVLATPPIAGGGAAAVAGKVSVPPSVAPGAYHLLAQVDAGAVVAESNEGNNTTGGPLQVAAVCAPDAWEPNDQLLPAPPWAPPVPAGATAGLVVCPGDVDWFSVQVPPAQKLSATIAFDPAVGDLDLRLYDPAFSLQLPVATSATSAPIEAVSYAPAVAGPLILRVHGFEGASAAYVLDTVLTGPP